MEQNPQRILIDSLTAPINGLYGIEDEQGNINYYNAGVLFGAIDVALFIIVIGGFLGVTMQTGANQEQPCPKYETQRDESKTQQTRRHQAQHMRRAYPTHAILFGRLHRHSDQRTSAPVDAEK